MASDPGKGRAESLRLQGTSSQAAGYLSNRFFLRRNPDDDFRAAVSMDEIVCTDTHFVESSGDGHVVELSREWLFIVVRMSEFADRDDLSIRIENLPSIGIMLPSVIVVFHGDRKVADRLASTSDLDLQYIRLAGKGRRPKNNREQNRPGHRFFNLLET